MRYSALIAGLLAEIASSAFVAPVELAVTNCAMPAQFTISNFMTFSDKSNGTVELTSFNFADAGTNITTACQQNSTSVSTSPNGGTARYYCDDENVQFIYQTTGIVGLTMIERACPARYVCSPFERLCFELILTPDIVIPQTSMRHLALPSST